MYLIESKRIKTKYFTDFFGKYFFDLFLCFEKKISEWLSNFLIVCTCHVVKGRTFLRAKYTIKISGVSIHTR